MKSDAATSRISRGIMAAKGAMQSAYSAELQVEIPGGQ
jgi:hypothetical protein